jgi:hypothetical protein
MLIMLAMLPGYAVGLCWFSWLAVLANLLPLYAGFYAS